LLTPNKTVLLKTPAGQVEVKALRITRELVTVQVSDQTIQLRIERPQPATSEAAPVPAAATGEPAAGDVEP
jgi:hypothetical protein